MANKKALESDTKVIRSLEAHGFTQEEKLDSFLQRPEHGDIQARFAVVFPKAAKPAFQKLASAPGEDMASDDKEIELSDGEELILSSDSEVSNAPLEDNGLDLSLDEGLAPLEESAADDGLSLVGDGVDDLSLSADSSDDGLSLGDDVDLGEDVVAKLKEIDDIMAKDSTMATVVKPSLAQLKEDDQGDDDLSSGLEEDGLAFEGTDSSLLGQIDEDVDLDAGLDLGDSLAGELGDELLANELTPPQPLDMSKAHKKGFVPPAAPAVVETDNAHDEEESLQFAQPSTPEPMPQPAELRQAMAEPYESRGPVRAEYQEAVGRHHAELERLQATLAHLRADREEILKKLDAQEEERIHHQRQLLGLRAELDEKKIEVQLLKKRLSEEGEEGRYRAQLETERRQLAEEKAKAIQEEVVALQQKVKLETRRGTGRERELEQQLELLKSDAETQIRHRDMKILELKRRLDAMEFEVENVAVMEKKAVGDKQELEVKLDKAIKTLRAAVGMLEAEDPMMVSLEKLKKNLDA